jgi:signal transduction histidine kinase
MTEPRHSSGSDPLSSDSVGELLARTVEGIRTEDPDPKSFLEAIVKHSPLAMFVCDSKGAIIFANAAARRVAQMEPEGGSRDFAHSLLGTLVDITGMRIAENEPPWMKAVGGEVVAQEYSLVRPESSLCTVFLIILPIALSRGIIGAVALLLDITQQKRAEHSFIDNALERQRSRFAADVHDTLSQDLTAIGLQLQAAEDDLSTNLADARDHLLSAQRAARRSLSELRRSIWMLSHDEFQGDDICIALSSLAAHLFAGTSITPELSLCDEPHSLQPDARRELLRIGKEALGNVLKHSRANTVRIALIHHQQGLELSISDNGQGFAPTSLSEDHGGLGLSSMRRRAAQLGGSFAVHTAPGIGTRIFVVVPLPSELIPASGQQALPIQ